MPLTMSKRRLQRRGVVWQNNRTVGETSEGWHPLQQVMLSGSFIMPI